MGRWFFIGKFFYFYNECGVKEEEILGLKLQFNLNSFQIPAEPFTLGTWGPSDHRPAPASALSVHPGQRQELLAHPGCSQCRGVSCSNGPVHP